MKKVLLLFIPLIFFFGCENEEESADCSCGEVIDIDVTPAFAGNLVPLFDANGNQVEIGGVPQWEAVGQHDGYSITRVQMNCSQDIITLCNILEIGDSFCFDYVGDCYFAECEWVEDVTVFDTFYQNVVTQDMLIQSITVNGGNQLQQGVNGQIVQFDCN